MRRLFRPEKWISPLRSVTIFLWIAFSSLLSGCQLLALPFFAIAMFGNLASQVIAQAFVLPFQLLPLAIKYAPLALLFLEKPSEDDTHYVEWLRPASEVYRAERLVTMDGREVTAILAPSSSLNTEAIIKNFSADTDGKLLLLTSQDFEKSTNKDLLETWELLREKPQTIWMSGRPAENMRKENQSVYI